ncbi:MAG: hypothetical protein FJZ63_05150 [Chlamydiae bacterium]|nr:hypothetical protein [Chlamydiota bacterium]
MRMKFVFVVLSGILSLYFVACTSSSVPKPKTGLPLVLVGLSPYNTFVQEIAGDTVAVAVAVPPNYNAHVFEPTPQHLAHFHEAVIWFGIGEPFESLLLKALKQYNPELVTVDLSHNLPLHHESTACLAPHSHTTFSQDETVDRHFWTSPHIAQMQAEVIAETLIRAFPENAALYKKNLENLTKKFEALDNTLRHTLAPFKGNSIIISHPSLGYFCADYDLIQIALECEGKTPLPANLAGVFAIAKSNKPLCVFTLEQFDNKGALLIAKELQIPSYPINPNLPNYFENFTNIASQIAGTPHESP